MQCKHLAPCTVCVVNRVLGSGRGGFDRSAKQGSSRVEVVRTWVWPIPLCSLTAFEFMLCCCCNLLLSETGKRFRTCDTCEFHFCLNTGKGIALLLRNHVVSVQHKLEVLESSGRQTQVVTERSFCTAHTLTKLI